MTGNRRGEARSALSAVQARHKEIQRIEQTIQELAELFQNMEQLVIEQEPMVEQIDQRGHEIQTDVAKAHTELETAVESAKSARRKKWWCLLICRKCSTEPCSHTVKVNSHNSHHYHHHCRYRGDYTSCEQKVIAHIRPSILSRQAIEYLYIFSRRGFWFNTFVFLLHGGCFCSCRPFLWKMPIV